MRAGRNCFCPRSTTNQRTTTAGPDSSTAACPSRGLSMWRDRSLCAVSVGFGRMAAFSSKRVTGTGIEAAGSSGFGYWIQLQRTVVIADRRASECEGGVAGAARSALDAGARGVFQSARSDSERRGVHGHRRHGVAAGNACRTDRRSKLAHNMRTCLSPWPLQARPVLSQVVRYGTTT